jgi:large repetitive protein
MQSPAGPYPLGSTTVTLTCTDSQQQSSSCTATVQVRDVTAPALALVGPTSQQAECGASYADPGATANDFCDGDLSGAIIRSGQVDPDTLGAYGLTYDVEDSSGNRAPSVMRTVNVRDTLSPVLTLHPPLNQVLECGTPYIDPGSTVLDQCFGDLTTVVRSGAVNSNVPGAYVMSYRAADPVGNPSPPQSRSVSVMDTLPPSITVLGPIEDSHECGTTYVDPGATATDQCAGNVPVVASRTGNPLPPGSFTITYSASDPSGTSSTSPEVRRVTVTDHELPVVTLNGPATRVVECGTTSYADPGATAADQCFGNLTGRIVRTGTVDPRVPDSYSLTYNVTDPAGNSAVPKNRTVTVVDTLAPVVTITVPSLVECDCGATYPDPDIIAIDECAGPLPVYCSSRVDRCMPGSYTLTCTVRDPSGNGGTFSRTVGVRDTLRPVVTLNGPGSITIVQGTPWNDPGATARDRCSGEVPITRVGHVNTDVPDTYVLRYIAVDVSGNQAVVASGIASRTSTPAR